MVGVSPIQNVKVNDLTDKGNLKVTYAKIETKDFGEVVRILVVDKNNLTYGVSSGAKQIVKTFKENELKGATVRFKAYTTEKGFTTLKVFIQSLPKDESKE